VQQAQRHRMQHYPTAAAKIKGEDRRYNFQLFGRNEDEQ